MTSLSSCSDLVASRHDIQTDDTDHDYDKRQNRQTTTNQQRQQHPLAFPARLFDERGEPNLDATFNIKIGRTREQVQFLPITSTTNIKMRQIRRFALGVLLIATLSLSTLSNVPLAHADVDVVDESADGVAEAVVDSAGDVHVDVSEILDEAVGAVVEDEVVPESAEEESTAAEDAVVVENDVSESSTPAFVSNVRAKAVAFADKAKEITPEQMKKVALGTLGIWGVAAGAGWVMNNLGGSDD